MSVDHAFLLSAGIGSRMGEIGQVLPKVLWPIFEKSLLELQYLFLKRFNPRSFYLNTHHQAESICDFLNSNKELPFHQLQETTLLDVGGAVINLVETFRTEGKDPGVILLNNCDQFLFFDEHIFKQGMKELESADVVLFCIKVNQDSGLNQVLYSSTGQMEGILKHSDGIPEQEYLTYSGMALVDGKRVDHPPGVVGLFQSVANYQQKNVKIIPVDKYDYWDFGTVHRYAQCCFNLLQSVGEFAQFCQETKALDLTKTAKEQVSYNFSSKEKVINLGMKQRQVVANGPVLLLDDGVPDKIERPGLYFQASFEPLGKDNLKF